MSTTPLIYLAGVSVAVGFAVWLAHLGAKSAVATDEAEDVKQSNASASLAQSMLSAQQAATESAAEEAAAKGQF